VSITLRFLYSVTQKKTQKNMPEIIEILQLNDDFFEPNRVKRQNSNNDVNIADQTTVDFGLLNEEFGSGTVDTETSTIFNDVEFTTEISTNASSVSTTVTSEGVVLFRVAQQTPKIKVPTRKVVLKAAKRARVVQH